MTRTLVAGVGVVGSAVVRALVARGESVVAADDGPTTRSVDDLAPLGVVVHTIADPQGWVDLVADVDRVVPSPGLGEDHPVLTAAERLGRPVRTELDLAGDWDDRPFVAVTGTNGKTTVTSLVADCLSASGRPALAVGNTDLPFVDAISDPAPVTFVVEASSFQLGRTERFEPAVAAWLNFAPDHLDLHRSIDTYRRAKQRIFRDLDEKSTAVVNVDDPVVEASDTGRAARITFGLEGGDWTVRGRELSGPGGERLPVEQLRRRHPHDIANALATMACATKSGVPFDVVAEVVAGFRGLPHRVALVGEYGGVSWYDDSKATTPHASRAALAGFESVVLIAGGRNKAVDLRAMRAPSVRSVVAIGEAAEEIASVFDGSAVVETARDMRDAVALAAGQAHPGDVVLLSPGCASFDWYPSYAARGDDFAAEVENLMGGGPRG